MKRFVKSGLIALCAVASISAVLAEEAASPEQQAVETRQGLLKVMGWSMAPVGLMLKNKIPFDAAVTQKEALRIGQIAAMIPDAFQVDTRKATTVKTKARDDIWAKQADFAGKADDLAKAASALDAAAKAGDKDATLKAAATVGKACKGCHDNFRNK
jgi:cytochrome c556